MDPEGRSRGLLLGWDKDVTVYQIVNISFNIEVEFETSD